MFKTDNKADMRAVMSEIAQIRRRGHGLRYQDWHIELPDSSAMDGLVETMLLWCKVTLSNCRRPYGIDLFDLVVAYRVEGHNRPQSFRLERVKPMELYQEPLPKTLLDRLAHALVLQPSKLYVSAALFSWGDALHKALPATPSSKT